MTAALWWLRNDFRLHDNSALHAARANGRLAYAVYCLDELPKANPRQRAFAIGCLQKLRLELAKHDASLSLLEGPPQRSLLDACSRLGATSVFCARAYAKAEADVDAAAQAMLSRASVELVRTRGNVVHDVDAIGAIKQSPGAGYRVFPPFHESWMKLEVERPLPEVAPAGRDERQGTMPDAPELTDPAPGETAAREQLQRFVTARAASYAFMGAYPASDGTSKLAPYLRFGCLSPRVVYHAIRERMARTWTLAQERTSMQAFLRRLAQRDFFLQLAHFAPEIHTKPLQHKMRGFEWSRDPRLAEAWTSGKTGYPLVDAALRQLAAKGYVHQRAAICAASFLCFDLGLDWRIGSQVWMERLISADQAICDGNWQWIAGTGSDQAAYPRIYNPRKQARFIDPQGVYIRRWVRELAKLPTRATLEPWELSRQQQTELGFFTPEQYPPPIVDHETAARAMLKKYQAYRQRG